ncbi:MAG: hypothetical protein ABJA67_07735, partial [Chthonomonadales bacterium]
MKIGNQVYDNSGKAGDAIIAYVEHVKNSTKELNVGDFNGFQVTVVGRGQNAPSVRLTPNMQGDHPLLAEQLSTSASESGIGMIQKLRNLLAELPQKMETQKKLIGRAKEDLEVYKGEIQPFDQEEELRRANQRLQEVYRELAKTSAAQVENDDEEQISKAVRIVIRKTGSSRPILIKAKSGSFDLPKLPKGYSWGAKLMGDAMVYRIVLGKKEVARGTNPIALVSEIKSQVASAGNIKKSISLNRETGKM